MGFSAAVPIAMPAHLPSLSGAFQVVDAPFEALLVRPIGQVSLDEGPVPALALLLVAHCVRRRLNAVGGVDRHRALFEGLLRCLVDGDHHPLIGCPLGDGVSHL